MRAAVIDIGSSTIKLVIAEKVDDNIKVIDSLKSVIDVGSDAFYRGRISQEIINKTISVLEKYKNVIQQYKVDHVSVVATTAVRESMNKDIFFDTVYRKTGFKVEIFNVGDVVYYIDSYLSHKLKQAYPIHERNLLIAELGAGSLDISVMEKGYTLLNIGLPIGTLRLKQFKKGLDGSQREVYEAMMEYVEGELLPIKKMFPNFKIDDVILIDESYSGAISQILPKKKNISDFFQFQYREAMQLFRKVTDGNLADKAFQYKIDSDISDSIDGYAIVLCSLYKLIKSRTIYILKTSLAEALLANVLLNVEISKKYNKTNQLVSVARFLCNRYGLDIRIAKQIAQLAEKLFKEFSSILGLQESDSLYLVLAAYLHNIGLFVSNRSHHKHSEYIINALNLFRLTDEEIKVIACIARYHRRTSPQQRHLVYGTLPQDKQILIQKLSAILRIASGLNASYKQKVKDIEIVMGKDREYNIIVYTNDNFLLEKANFLEKKGLFEEISGTTINLIVKKAR